MKRGIVVGAVLVLVITVGLTIAFAPRGNKVSQIAQPYSFSVFGWEVRHFPDKWLDGLRGVFSKRESVSEEDAQVRRYFVLVSQTETLAREVRDMERGSSAQGTASLEDLKSRLSLAQKERDALSGEVEGILEARLTEVLASQGLDFRLVGKSVFLFPPVDFKFDLLPKILITSPRERIELKDSILVRSNITLEGTERLEKSVEKQGLSALVEGLGGFSTYPSMVSYSSSLQFTLSSVAHEWLHQYFFFHPLGQHYWDNYSMVSLNETIADLAGEEIGDLLLEKHGKAWGVTVTPRRSPTGIKKSPPSFFEQQMRQIRLKVDELLAQGRVEDAERYMEEQRLFLAEKGYYIRKLNQAYFAFHGSYGDSATASSPIAGELRQLRSKSPSLGDFVKRVSSISSYEQFKKLLGE